MSYDTENFASA